MGNSQPTGVDVGQARNFLTRHLAREPLDVALVGEGAWSRCFGFRLGDEAFVVRFGKHVEDFRKDQVAYAYAAPGLPIPRVVEIGEAFDGYYAISTRAYGVPLEGLDTSDWLATLPSLVSALEAMRTADLSSTQGYGDWGIEGKGSHTSWSSHLLAIGEENPDYRTYGWRERLRASPEGEAAFVWGLELLKDVVSDSAPRGLIHADLMNRNVLVNDASITGVFDWGCSRYGDHLYDLAWFDFWAPWHSNLDVCALWVAVEKRWREVGYVPHDKEARLIACYLHIGLDHLGYNAYMGNSAALLQTAERMRATVTSAQV